MASIRKSSRDCEQKDAEFVQKYLGTKRKFLCLKAADRDKILRTAAEEVKKLDSQETIKILDELFSTDTFEDFNFAGKLLTRLPEVRKALKLSQIKKWVSHSNGWAECDSICQSLFHGKEIPLRWDEWQKAIRIFSKDKNIQIRRSSLVLQVKPVRESNDQRLRKLAFETIEKLKVEKEVLITKAISWLLRELTRQNKAEVRKYLENNKSSLPAIAYREAMRKIITGKK
jgi:3-methyladenine DNA glycosylase AlkD